LAVRQKEKRNPKIGKEKEKKDLFLFTEIYLSSPFFFKISKSLFS